MKSHAMFFSILLNYKEEEKSVSKDIGIKGKQIEKKQFQGKFEILKLPSCKRNNNTKKSY